MSKLSVMKGTTSSIQDTPYVEGKVYFIYENTESEDISIYADIDGVRRKIKEGVQREELNNYLLKTDIAAWAKETTKPSYTAAEVGALSTSHSANGITSTDISNWNYAYNGYTTLQWNNVQKALRASKQGAMVTLFEQSDMAYDSTNNTTGFLTLADLPIYDGTVV